MRDGKCEYITPASGPSVIRAGRPGEKNVRILINAGFRVTNGGARATLIGEITDDFKDGDGN